MPIYEYQCKSCHYHMEMMQNISDNEITLCPKCGQNTLARLISAVGFRLKGTGWYATDYSKDKTKPTDKPTDASKKTKNKPENQ